MPGAAALNGAGWALPLSLVASIGSVVALALSIGGAAGLVYLAVYIAATLPGWPIGFWLFGRSHALGWLSGALIGYALTCLAIWGVALGGPPSSAALVLGWAVTAVSVWVCCARRRMPAVSLPAWTRRDTTALLFLLVLVPLLFWFPYSNLGVLDREGNKNYRAYFTADFVWHTALTAEMTKFATPPVNPYLGDRDLHYYWTYFLLPAATAARGPAPLRDVERCLKLNAAFTGVLFLAAVMLFAWSIVPSGPAAALGTVLVAVAASAEGNYALHDLYSSGRALSGVTDLNIDAVTAWVFRGLRIDSLARSMWYNPQHSLSCALGLVALPVAAYSGVHPRLAALVLAGVALGGATIFNPLIGGILSLIYGLIAVGHAVGRAGAVTGLLRHTLPAVIVAAAIAWCSWNAMLERSEATVGFGLIGFARNAPLETLFLSLGPVLIPAIAAFWGAWKAPLRVWPPLAALAVGLLLFYFVNLSVEASYIGFRAGQIIQVSIAPMVALFLLRLYAWHWGSAALALVLIAAAGLPTTIIDTFNAQDVNNRSMGPGFRWTMTLSPFEQGALTWVRAQTRPDAIVQMDPIARGLEHWSHIPTFAHRRMWAGLPLLWVDIPPYAERSRAVHELYVTTDIEVACRLAKGRIDYLYVGFQERQRMVLQAREKFSADGSCFSLAFDNGEVKVYQVQ
jgi:hypothetical protein